MPDLADLVSITVTPDPASFPEDGLQQFAATGTFADTSTADVTGDAYWRTYDDFVATTNSSQHSRGLVLGVAAGVTQVSAVITTFALGPVIGYADVTVTAADPAAPDPAGRFLLAFDDATLEPYPAWTRIDSHDNLVTSYTIDRGRTSELDQMDAGRATVQVTDPNGTLDPTNPSGPYYGRIRLLMQASIGRRNPVTDTWHTRFRGFVEDLNYEIDPSQQVNRLTVSLVDLTEITAAAEMAVGQFGLKFPDVPPPDQVDQITFPAGTVDGRIYSVLVDYGLAGRFRSIFPAISELSATVYTPGESIMTTVLEAAEAEFPGGVATVYCDRRGRLCFHDRMARFYPADRAASVTGWDFQAWKAGDGAAIAGSPSDTAQLRQVAYNLGISRLINSATASPADIADDQVEGQLVVDPASAGYYGIRSWSATNLLTGAGTPAARLTLTKQYAQYFVANYKAPQNLVTQVGFRALDPADPRAAANWALVNGVDVSDTLEVTVASAGGGGFESVTYFVEGVHEDVKPANPDYDDVTVTLNLSPQPAYPSDPFPE